MTHEVFVPDRSEWLAFLEAMDCLIAPAEAVRLANNAIDWRELAPE